MDGEKLPAAERIAESQDDVAGDAAGSDVGELSARP
jgi:hypothetical protein